MTTMNEGCTAQLVSRHSEFCSILRALIMKTNLSSLDIHTRFHYALVLAKCMYCTCTFTHVNAVTHFERKRYHYVQKD